MSADFWAGYVSGAAGIVIGNPLDLVKVRLQASSTSSSPSHGATRTSSYSASSLFRGLPAPVITYGALNALLFTTYNRSLLLFPSTNSTFDAAKTGPEYSYMGHFAAGCIAGLATFVVSAPTELIKCRTQLAVAPSTTPLHGQSCSPSSWSITKSIWQQYGLRGLYHGGVITSIRDSVGYGFYFLSYEASKDLWDLTFPRNEAVRSKALIGSNEAAKVLLCGGLAGVVTWVSIFPLDVIKTRLQTQTSPQVTTLFNATAAPPNTDSRLPTPRDPLLGVRAPLSNESISTVHANSWTIARHAYRTEGMHVFFRGLTVCCVRAFIVNAVQWAVYEWMMQYLLE